MKSKNMQYGLKNCKKISSEYNITDIEEIKTYEDYIL